MSESQPTLYQRARQLKRIYAAFCAGIFIYAGVISMSLQKPGTAADVSALRPLLMLSAVVLGGASIWWRRRATGETQFMPAEKPTADSFEQLQTSCIITWAFSEAVAIIGLVLALLSRDLGAFMPFGVAALALMIVHRPSAWPQWPIESR